uniref:DNA helicase n=2 Tax=Tanacetum cinerariifolium TaxID=118510 RepID=A0A6L2MYM8_TANCI|nr:DNA helicase [Tanacetum cinerariifolium]
MERMGSVSEMGKGCVWLRCREGDDNVFNSGSTQEYTSNFEEIIKRRESTRLSTGGHDVVPTTTVHVSRIFDCFRNMRLNNVGSDYMSLIDNQNRAGDQRVRTRSLENPGYQNFYTPFWFIFCNVCFRYSWSHCFFTTNGTDESCIPIITYGESIQMLLIVESYTIKRLLSNDCSILGTEKTQNDEETLNPEIVEGLIHVLDEHNGLVRLFRTVQDRFSAGEIPAFKIRLYNKGGFFPDLILKPRDGTGKGKKVSMQAYYKYRLHPRVKEFRLIFRGGRLFQQYVVAVFCVIEQSRLDWVHNQQNNLCSDYLLGLYDAVSLGDHEGIQAGSKIMLPRIFTRGPRYMYSHYLDALVICSKIRNAIKIDEYNSAEIPDPMEDPRGYKVVTELMMHGPCGVVNLSASCMENRVCNKHFPKRSIGDASTSMGEKHIQVDEIQNYVDGRFVCPFKACWRIFEFLIHCKEPAVQILNVHLENAQSVTFRKRDRLDIIVNMPKKKKTMLTEWYVPKGGENKKSLGRLTYVYPNSGELFYFQMLLSHQKGCKSPTEVRTVNGYVLPTYRVACEALVMEDDIPPKVSDATGIFNYHVNTPELQGYILYELEAILNGFGKSVKDFGLPPPPQHLLKNLKNKLLMEEKNYKRNMLMQDAAHFVPKLNHD